MWLGVLLVAASVVAGANLLASADDTVAVWQVVRDVPSGTELSSSDVRATRVHFDERSAADHYLPATLPLASGAHATHDLHAGEMLAITAISSAESPIRRQLPLGVAATDAPADLHAGDSIEVWAVADKTDGRSSAGQAHPILVLPDVDALSIGTGQSGVSGERQILVGLRGDVDVGEVLRLVSGARIVLVRLAG